MKLSIEIIIAGILVSTGAYCFACTYMRYKPAKDLKVLRNFMRGLLYVFTLVCETAKANMVVFQIVFSRNIKINPRLIYFRTNLKTNVARVAFANSLTLTPGTITVSLDDGKFCVHCLDSKIAEGIEDSIFIRQLQKFEDYGND